MLGHQAPFLTSTTRMDFRQKPLILKAPKNHHRRGCRVNNIQKPFGTHISRVMISIDRCCLEVKGILVPLSITKLLAPGRAMDLFPLGEPHSRKLLPPTQVPPVVGITT